MSKTFWKVGLLLFAAAYFLGCGGSSTLTSGSGSGSSLSSGTSTVYKTTGLPKFASTGTTAALVVLPSTAQAPANATPVPGATVTFIQDTATTSGDSTATTETVTADQNGQFNVPTTILNSSQTEAAQPQIVVNDPSGAAAPATTTLAVGVEDTGETPLSLKVVPEESRMPTGSLRAFHALKVLPNGKVARAKNVTWNCTGNLAKDTTLSPSDGSFAVCKATAAGTGTVTASVTAGGGLTASASVTIFDATKFIEISGTVKDSTGAVVGAGWVMNFSLPPKAGGERPIHIAAPTDSTGTYHLFLPPVSATEANLTYFALIGTPMDQGAKIYQATPSNLVVTTADNGTALTAKDFQQGALFTPPNPPPPFDRIIQNAWGEVNGVMSPDFFEPFHGLRTLFSVADGSGQFQHRGMFNGFCYEKTGNTIVLTEPDSTNPTAPCPNNTSSQKITLVLESKTSTSATSTWTRELKDPSGTLFKAGVAKITDTLTCPTNSSCYISEIDAVTQLFAPDNPTAPFDTTVAEWKRGPLTSGEQGRDDEIPVQVTLKLKACSHSAVWDSTKPNDQACGSEMPLRELSVTRDRVADPTNFSTGSTVFLTFFGSSSFFLRFPDGSLQEIKRAFCSQASPCQLKTDGSGSAQVAEINGNSTVSFTLLAFNDPSVNRATGTLSLKLPLPDGTKKSVSVSFVITSSGQLQLTLPDGSTAIAPAGV